MDLPLNNLQRLICLKIKPIMSNFPRIHTVIFVSRLPYIYVCVCVYIEKGRLDKNCCFQFSFESLLIQVIICNRFNLEIFIFISEHNLH